MNLFDLTMMIIIVLVFFQFWRLRAIAEQAKIFLNNYCETYQLQLLSVARKQTRLKSFRGKLDWHCQFSFEFSGNGLEKQQGTLKMAGLIVIDTQLPAYKVN